MTLGHSQHRSHPSALLVYSKYFVAEINEKFKMDIKEKGWTEEQANNPTSRREDIVILLEC